MKTLKLLGAVTLCSALFAGAAFAQEGAVYSLNVVGFQKVEVKDDATPLTMASTPFDSEDSDVNTVVGEQLGTGNSFEQADNILLWDVTSQQYNSLFRVGDVGMPEYNQKWIDKSSMQVATNEIVPGMGFWIRSRQSSTQTVVVVGDVVSDDTITCNVAPGLQMMAYPFSAPIALNDTTFTNGATMGNSFESSDNILVWDTSVQQYNSYFLVGDVGMPAYNYKWIRKSDMSVATNILQPGVGFWYRSRGASQFSWVENRPYDLD